MNPASQKILENTRNIGISAHIDSGKTTLTERVLYYAGKIHKIEEVRGGGAGATMDHMELEKEKGITITSAATSVNWKDKKINIIDTPGHVDFTVEVERSLRVLDGAIMILCGVAGIQSQSITVDRQMKRYRVPRLAFINKLDRMGANPDNGIKGIREILDLNAVALQIPIGLEENHLGIIDLITMKASYFDGEHGDDVRIEEIPAELLADAESSRAEMLEAVSMFDDQMMEDLLDDKEISEQSIHAAVKIGVQTLELCPVFMGSAFKNKGVQTLLDAVINYLPTPLEAMPTKATELKTQEEVLLSCDPDKPTVAMAFKLTEEQFGQLTYTRVYQGKLTKGEQIINSRTGNKMRIGRMVRMHSNDRENIDFAEAGDIIAMVGVDCASGDTFCGEGIRVACESIFVPDAVISLAVKGKDNEQHMKMSKALGRFMREDPTFHVSSDIESGETIISGMGELHLEIIVDRLKREFNVAVHVGPPQVAYKECITKEVEHEAKFIRQSGGRGQYGHVVIKIEPNEAGKGFEFINKIVGGSIPKEYIPPVENGVKESMSNGILSGYPLEDIKVTLLDGSYHDVDSSEIAFKIAGSMALRDAARKAAPTLLEPLMALEVVVPEDYLGSIMGDVTSRRGNVKGMNPRNGVQVLNAEVPLSEMFGYATELRSMTQGRAVFTMQFSHYAKAPNFIVEQMLEKFQGKTIV